MRNRALDLEGLPSAFMNLESSDMKSMLSVHAANYGT